MLFIFSEKGLPFSVQSIIPLKNRGAIRLNGSGGMQTKIEAAKICQLAGSTMAIANGLYTNPLKKIIENNNCTWFSPKVSKLDARKKWIISSLTSSGKIYIDQGAARALDKGKRY